MKSSFWVSPVSLKFVEMEEIESNGGAEAVINLEPGSTVPISYHPCFGPHEDLLLLEADDKLVSDTFNGRVTLRGLPDEDAVLCTKSKTCAIKFVGNSNSIPPSICPGLIEEVSVIKLAPGNMELVEVSPRLDKLKQILSEHPFGASEVEGMMNDDNWLESNVEKDVVLYTWSDLVNTIQASDEELRKGLESLCAVEIDGYWRVIDESYMDLILRMLLDNCVLNDWSFDELDEEEVVNGLVADKFPSKLASHCLRVFGSEVEETNKWKLEPRLVGLHFARQILKEEKMRFESFMEEWKKKIPEKIEVKFEMLEGEVLTEKNGIETRVYIFSVRSLPSTPAERFAALFKHRPKWEWKDLEPYLRDLHVPKLSMEGLLLKYTRRAQPRPDVETKISNEIPFDLIPDILKRLPVKTLARFLCLSKQYASIISNRDFIKSYVIKSTTRPQDLIFTFTSKHSRRSHFFSAKSELSTSSSPSVSTYHCHPQPCTSNVLPSVHGLICYGLSGELMVYNPSMRRIINLPKINSPRQTPMQSYVGYDPIDCDYKVLCIIAPWNSAPEPWVMTLGNGTSSWRMIKNFPSYAPSYAPMPSHICIDGVLYYIAYNGPDTTSVMSFDVRSEKFNRVETPLGDIRRSTKLTKYEGKLALIYSESERVEIFTCRVEMRVLLDAAKHEWSVMKSFKLNMRKTEPRFKAFCLNDAGEFVLGPESLLPDNRKKEKTPRGDESPFHVTYYDLKKGTMRRVYVEGITERKFPYWDGLSELVSIFPNQVENLMFL